MKKSIFVLMLASAVTMSAVFANGQKETSNQSAVGKVPAGTNVTGYPITDEPTTLTIFDNFANIVFNPSWSVFQQAAEKTNISLKSVISLSNSNEQGAYNLMISSGKLADIISYKHSNELEQLGRNGGLIPLNDLIDSYAPHIKAVMDSDPDFKAEATSPEGDIYYVPKGVELKFTEFYWIRMDWLKKLGLEVPTTVDELHDVLYAFRNEDPNGNGLKDEVPLFDRKGTVVPDEYLLMWDSSLDFWVKDGKAVFDPMEPEFEVATTNFAQWYKEGIVDPEYFTRGQKSRDTLLAGDLGGFTHDWASTGSYKANVQSQIPGFDFEAIPPVKAPNGSIVLRDKRVPMVGWGISSSCKNPIAAMRYFDYFFTEEGNDAINWGIKGDTYDVDENGNKYFTDKVMKSSATPLGELRKAGVQYRIGRMQDGDYEMAFMSPDSLNAAKLYSSHPEWYADNGTKYNTQRIALKILPEDDARYQKLMVSNIRPYVDEKYQSWILGTNDFKSEYPAFKEELKKRGIDEVIAIVQRAYDASQKN